MIKEAISPVLKVFYSMNHQIQQIKLFYEWAEPRLNGRNPWELSSEEIIELIHTWRAKSTES